MARVYKPLNDSELATILHTLRCLQGIDSIDDDSCDHFEDGAQRLDDDAIDELCERLNLDSVAVLEDVEESQITETTADKAVDLIKQMARFTLDGECTNCGKDASGTETCCDDMNEFEGTNDDEHDTIVSLTMRARDILKAQA